MPRRTPSESSELSSALLNITAEPDAEPSHEESTPQSASNRSPLTEIRLAASTGFLNSQKIRH